MEREYHSRPIEVVLECPKCHIEMKERQMVYPYSTAYHYYKCPTCPHEEQSEKKYPYIKYVREIIKL
jgi:ssDNA-binding Zn-finger/Zn-ribbon topoisomerase 1